MSLTAFWFVVASVGGCRADKGGGEPDPESDNGAGEADDSGGAGDSGAGPDPWCTDPTSAVQFEDVADAWDLLDTVDGETSRQDHNPVAVADFDNDGDDDVIIARRTDGLWYHENVGGAFNVSALADYPNAVAVAVGDVDGDRVLDVVSAGWEDRPLLLLGDGGGGFTDATDASGLSAVQFQATVRHAVFGDLNGDGAMDLVFTQATPTSTVEEEGRNRFLLGDGEGAFTEVSDQLESDQREGLGWATVLFDLDTDGDLDVYIVNAEQVQNGPSILLRNETTRGGDTLSFTDLSENCSCDWIGNPMGASVADFDGDTLPDLYVTNTGPSKLLVNMGDGSFADFAAAWGAGTISDSAAMTYGSAVYDYDNDGWLDLLVASGPLHGAQPIDTQPSEQPDVLLQGGAKGFTDVSTAQGVDDPEAGRGVGVGLLDDDGFMDAVVTHLDAPSRLFMSACTANRALVVDLVGAGHNTFGVGARVFVELGDRTLVREVTSNGGWASSIHPRAHFGLGQDPVGSVWVEWLGGEVQDVEVHPMVDGRITVTQDE